MKGRPRIARKGTDKKGEGRVGKFGELNAKDAKSAKRMQEEKEEGRKRRRGGKARCPLRRLRRHQPLPGEELGSGSVLLRSTDHTSKTRWWSVARGDALPDGRGAYVVLRAPVGRNLRRAYRCAWNVCGSGV